MSIKLSEGALSIILGGGHVDDPIMQVLSHKKIKGTTSSADVDRFRLLLSDGKHLNSFAMLTAELNHIVTSGELSDYTVVQITRYTTSMVTNIGKGDKRVLLILDVKILVKGTEIGFKLGNPRPITDETDTNASAPVTRPDSPQPSTSQTSNVPVVSSPGGSTHRIHPIASLNPYQNRSVIKVRVASKSRLSPWSNARGKGILFSMDLVDKSGGIRAKAFKEQCEKFCDIIEENKVYLISGCKLKTADKRFTKHDYEMIFTDGTQVEPCNEDSADIPYLTFDFIPISTVVELQTGSVVDVIGVCKSFGDIKNLIVKTTNREVNKREVTIVDESDTAINLILWGAQAEEFDGSLQPVLAVKNGHINEFRGGKSISLLKLSVFKINPDIEEAHRLRIWFDNIGATHEQINISTCSGSESGGNASNLMTLREAMDNQLGRGDKPDYFSCIATVLYLKHENALYKACPTADCKKKVIDQNNGMYRCEKCNREYPNFKHSLLIPTCLGDATNNQWVTCFQDTGEILLGKTSQEVGDLYPGVNEFQNIFVKSTFKKYLFRLRAQMETFNNETRLKLTAVDIKPVPIKEYNKKLIFEIKELACIDR